MNRQSTYSTRKPPSVGPSAGATSDGMPKTLSASPRSCRREGGEEHRRTERQERAATQSLQDAEENQRIERRRKSAERGGGREGDERDHINALDAEAIGEKARDRDDDAERERVVRHHALCVGDARAEILLQGGECDIDDRVIEDGHECPEDHRKEHPPLVSVVHALVASRCIRRLGCRTIDQRSSPLPRSHQTGERLTRSIPKSIPTDSSVAHSRYTDGIGFHG